MDLLPYPEDPVQPPIQIKFMGSQELDDLSTIFGPSMDWPYWRSRQSYWAIHAESSEHAKLVQIEVYFGFLRSLIGPAFCLDDFLVDSCLISLANLPGILLSLGKDSFRNCPSEDVRSLQELSDMEWTKDSTTSTSLYNVKLSLIALTAFLGAFWGQFDQLGPLRLRPLLATKKESIEIRHAMQERLISSGWCLYWTKGWGCRFSFIFLYFLSGLRPWRSDLVNAIRNDCVSFCYCNNVNEDTYSTKHSITCSADQCSFVGPDAAFISEAVARGRIPLVKMIRRATESASEKQNTKLLQTSKWMPRKKQTRNIIASWSTEDAVFELEIVEWDSKQAYIAISHVWSGGLGNFQQNKLPRCQLEYLFRSVFDCQRFEQAAHHSKDSGTSGGFPLPRTQNPKNGRWFREPEQVHFWLDTICVPVGKNDPNKMKAINQMEEIYSSAAHVLIVDPLLRDMAFGSNSEAEIAARLGTSSWWTRCWTLQEGMLSKSLIFSLRDATLMPLNWVYGGNGWIDFEAALEKSTIAAMRAQKTRRLPLSMDSKLEAAVKCAVLEAFIDLPNFKNGQRIDALRKSTKRRVIHQRESFENDYNEAIAYLAEIDGFSIDEGHDCYEAYKEKLRYFNRIWNELARRSTTKPEDALSILAIATGLLPSELAIPNIEGSQLPFSRMKTILRSQEYLSLEMLFPEYSGRVPLCPIDRWVPSFPDRYVNMNGPVMSWSPDGSGLSLPFKSSEFPRNVFVIKSFPGTSSFAIRFGQVLNLDNSDVLNTAEVLGMLNDIEEIPSIEMLNSRKMLYNLEMLEDLELPIFTEAVKMIEEAVVLQGPIDHSMKGQTVILMLNDTDCTGAAFSLQRRTEKALFIRFHCFVEHGAITQPTNTDSYDLLTPDPKKIELGMGDFSQLIMLCESPDWSGPRMHSTYYQFQESEWF